MSTKSGAALLLAVLFAATPSHAEDPYAGLLDGPVPLNEAVRAVQGCTTDPCEAVRDISQAVDAMFTRNVANSLGRGRPRSAAEYRRDVRAADAAVRRMTTHKERSGLYCAVLAKLAGGYSHSTYTDVISGIEVATRLDATRGRNDPPCTPRMMAALPKQLDVDGPTGLISAAHEDCVADRRHGCDAIRRPQAVPNP